MLVRSCLFGLLLVATLEATALAQTPLPNVIYFMLDDLGPGEYSSYDNLHGLGATTKIATPNIDQLATNGMRFTNAHSATSLCAPTRAAIMAGTPIWQTNTRWGFGSASLQNGQQSVGDLMQAAGYRTGLMGKGHIGGDIYEVGSDNTTGKDIGNLANMDFDRPLKDGMKEHGYDYTFNMIAGIQARPYFFWEDDLATDTDANGNSTRITNANKSSMIQQWNAGYDDGVTEISPGASGIGSVNWRTRDVPQAMLNKAVDFMDNSLVSSPTQPFFLHYNSVAGHWPYVAPTSVQVDINGDSDTNDPGESYNIDGYDGSGPAPDDLGTESMQMVSVSDAEVGVLVSYLEQTDDPRNPGHKLIDNTMVIYTSDNGGIGPGYTNQHGPLDRDEWDVYGHDSTAGLRENKAYYYEGGHRVPFIVQWPGQVPAGSVRDQRISNVDLMGTLAGLTGQSLVEQGQGSHNLLPVFTGERDDNDPIRDNLIVDDTGGASDGVSRKLYYEDNWKLVLGTGTNPPLFEVYDLNTDPAETTDLSGSADPNVQQRISDMYANHVVERNAARLAPVFVGKNSTVNLDDVSLYTDVDVEGVLEGRGQVNGNLDLNNSGTLKIIPELVLSQTISAIQSSRLDEGGSLETNTRISAGRDNDGELQRGLVDFDLTSINVPAGETIVGARMVFRVGFSWAHAVSDSPALEVYPLLGSFEEASATWNESESGVPWTTPGGDFDDTTLLGNATGFDPSTVNGGDELVVDDPALLADLIANLTDSSYSLMVKYNDASELSGLINAVWLDSTQKGPAPPRLEVTFADAPESRSIGVSGDFTQRSGSTLEIRLGAGSTPGVDFDQLIVSGDIELMGGELEVLLDTGFAPQLGDSFDILDFSNLTGAFESIDLPALPGELVWGVKDLLTLGTINVIAAGDFDEDGDVDQDDLARWNTGFGTSGTASREDGDANGDRRVDTSDFLIWQRTVGMEAPQTLPVAETVPEPSVTGILLSTLFVFGSRRQTIARSPQ